MRSAQLLALVLLASSAGLSAQSPAPERLSALQGEYAGTIAVSEGAASPLGLQVIAESGADGPAVRGVLLVGGLPGAGWARGNVRQVGVAPLTDAPPCQSRLPLNASMTITPRPMLREVVVDVPPATEQVPGKYVTVPPLVQVTPPALEAVIRHGITSSTAGSYPAPMISTGFM